ncbi:Wzy polymerase domain-containing protein [Variovorax ginsengisoli]|uniref:Wzy polymerase domain-containing protein n=1 Tax=Variovorax ginsengisoli TaxID=363844 RepID=A0ABT8RX79_9BURK|nr:Wzy polymerase domain-containing protein [Variovorax ginsengisoli]MDN8612080.1 Wzy polymerase domain-containing protein [Variovorax ginsengisoli]MDO1531250.1 Wzy polymerase domain-containing protein [Variovorax ginsengisoli]
MARDQRLPAYRDHPLDQAQRSLLFEAPVAFARLTLTPVDPANAAEMHALAQRVLHYSPEPSVIVKLIDSAVLLGEADEAAAQAARFKAAFPHQYGRWLAGLPLADDAPEQPQPAT